MALIDFKKYLVKVQGQYLEMKEDLEDFTEGLKQGYVTEEQVEEAKNDVFALEQNYQRLLYVAYLLEIPKRKEKQEKHAVRNKNITEKFKEMKADTSSVLDENTSLLTHLRTEMKKLTTEKK